MPPEPRGLFVTGTDTGVGKTVLSAALAAAMLAAGEPVAVHKPVVTGLDETATDRGSPARWPPDHELLALAGGCDPAQVAPHRFGPAVSPHLAAALAGRAVDGHELIVAATRAGRGRTLVVEGVGGLLVPLSDTFSVRDLALALGLPLVIAARPGLGTINHTLLTIDAARSAGLRVAAVVLTPWPEQPGELERSNLRTIAALRSVEVATLAEVARPQPEELRRAGASLPWPGWL